MGKSSANSGKANCMGGSYSTMSEHIKIQLEEPFIRALLMWLVTMLTLFVSSMRIGSFVLRLSFLAIGFQGVMYVAKLISKGRPLPAQFGNDMPLMKDKTIVVTGCNCGIGYATVQQLILWRAAKIVMACRDAARADEALKRLTAWKSEMGQQKHDNADTYNTELIVVSLDLSDLESVKKCAAAMEEKKLEIDVLVNNAGVMFCPFTKTKQGHELQWGTNHLGHFLLTKLLLPNVERNNGRIINLSSLGHVFAPVKSFDSWEAVAATPRDKYSEVTAYGWSKLSNALFSRHLQKRLTDAKSKVLVVAVHPGAVKTELGRHTPGWLTKLVEPFSRTPSEGASTSLMCCVEKDLVPGAYYGNCGLMSSTIASKDDKLAQKLWDASEKMVEKFVR